MTIASNKLLTALKQLSLQNEKVTHTPILSCAEHIAALNELDVKKDFVLCKSLFVTNKKTKENYLIVLKTQRNFNFNQIGKFIGVNGNHLRLGNDDLLEDILQVKRGAINPLAIMFDRKNEVRLFIDQALMNNEKLIGLNPMINTSTIFLKPESIKKFVNHYSHKPSIINFDEEIIEPQKNLKEPKKQDNNLKKKQEELRDEKGLTVSKKENFARWYSEVVTKSKMIEYYDISGCYILRPNSCFIWNKIKEYFSKEIAKLGVDEAYFPMFVSKKSLEAESAHIDGFKPEVAWVTKSGDSDLAMPVAIRPTSETIMYPIYRNWIRSYRDLPVKINQWSNIVRWEFKNPTPFIRTREFLWQEGHSAFETKEEADSEVLDILELYSRVYESLLAVPVIKGKKTEIEKFPGGDYTTTVEAFVPETGRSIQGATSHSLGQNFGKIFNIEFVDDERKKRIPYQNSWGLTTRSIGVMIMVHGDDKGLIVPPKVAKYQVVVIPILSKFSDEKKLLFRSNYMDIVNNLTLHGMRATVDERPNYKPGWKYNHWELQGVPIRIEFGPKDMEKNQCIFVRRDTGEKTTVPLHKVHTEAETILQKIQQNLLRKARERAEKKKRIIRTWAEFEIALNEKCFVEAPFCGRSLCENEIKEKTRILVPVENVSNGSSLKGGLSGSAKSLCIPFKQQKLDEGMKCFACDKNAKEWTMFGRSY